MVTETTDVLGEVAKRGDRYLIFGLHRGYAKPSTPTGEERSFVGVTFTLKALPALEDFMRNLGSGEKQPVEAFGRGWVGLPGERPLEVYDLSKSIDFSGLTVAFPGNPFEYADRNLGRKLINLSFLRLAGISEGAGIRFGIKDVYPKEDLIKLKGEISRACKMFCDEFLCPIDMTCTISSY